MQRRVSWRSGWAPKFSQSPRGAMGETPPSGRGERWLIALLRRDQLPVLAALLLLSALCWWYLIALAASMSAMDMQAPAAFARMQSRGLFELGLLFVMWAVMMVGMMLPSAAPMILLYHQVAKKAASEQRALAPTTVFTLGYLLAWLVFSVGATLAQWLLEQLSLMSPAMVATSPWLGAGVVVAAGVYQLTPWKDRCLEYCRNPAWLLSRHWRPGVRGALTMGMIHGYYCLGCCWVLMGLLFVGGVMNLLWIAVIAIFVLIEKLAPRGRLAGTISGLGLIGAGAVMLALNTGSMLL